MDICGKDMNVFSMLLSSHGENGINGDSVPSTPVVDTSAPSSPTKEPQALYGNHDVVEKAAQVG